ncbi:MAG: hypothetical protein IJO33_01175 [Bacilli bacterium]|nr:hypothetical protein [Bacilli bacterium]
MKNIERSLVLVITLLVIGAVVAASYFAFTNDDENIGGDPVIESFEMNYADYPYIAIQDKYEIVNSAKELDDLLNAATENNPNNSEMIGKIRDKYANFNFDKFQIVILNTSGSGCDYDDIKTNFILDIEKDVLLVKNQVSSSGVTCARFMNQVTIVEIPSKNINVVSSPTK